MAQTNNTIQSSGKEIFEVNPAVLDSALGYSAKIDDDNLMVVPNLYSEGFNSQNEKIVIIKEKGFVLVNGVKTASGKFEKLTDKQLFQLVTACVVLLSPQQQAEFRKKFFGLTGPEPESEKKK
jgi:hypothetical protein